MEFKLRLALNIDNVDCIGLYKLRPKKYDLLDLAITRLRPGLPQLPLWQDRETLALEQKMALRKVCTFITNFLLL